MPVTLQEARQKVQRCNEKFAEIRTRTLVILLIIGLILFVKFQQDSNRQEIQLLRDSLSNFYKEFNPAIFKDVPALKEYLNKVRKPLIDLVDLHYASDKVGKQIEILHNFHLDKTGRPDLALESSGGRVAGIGNNTKLFYSCNFLYKLVGCPNAVNPPKKVIQPSTNYNECFKFKGKKGSVIIKLFNEAILDSVTIEHITKKMSPTGEVTSAPRKFTVSGIDSSKSAFKFGSFEFEANKTSIETFEFPNRASFPHRHVKFEFTDNNGHPNETCVYRLRVHGVVEKN